MKFLVGAGNEAPEGPFSLPNIPSFQTTLRFGLAGALCCSLTHIAVIPIDVVKTRLQTNPGKYRGMADGFRKISAEEGARMLLKGAGPTAVGYFVQGAFRFGLNEVFKAKVMREVGVERAQRYRLPIWLGAAATAEFIADFFLCPLEATRIRLVAQPEFARGLVDGLAKIVKTEGALSLYKGLSPLILKQVPYTMTKFAVFEASSELVYSLLPYKKAELSTSNQLSISLACGVVAGVVAAVVSQPADTLLSKINQEKSTDGFLPTLTRIVKRLGFSGLFLGTGARSVMVGAIAAGQFFIYDYIKIVLGVSPTQLKEKERAELEAALMMPANAS